MKILKIPSLLMVAFLLCTGFTLSSSKSEEEKKAINTLVVDVDLGKETISKHIYGHFSEHLGRCIYGGYWVGEDSSVLNTRGIRNDIVEALKKINILRHPF